MTRYTEKDNEFLKNVKQHFNGKIFAHAKRILNEQSEEKAREFVQRYCTKPLQY